ncbi:MAG: hypothetical protein Q9194_006908 [Teloschistes cf. exilis]
MDRFALEKLSEFQVIEDPLLPTSSSAQPTILLSRSMSNRRDRVIDPPRMPVSRQRSGWESISITQRPRGPIYPI